VREVLGRLTALEATLAGMIRMGFRLTTIANDSGLKAKAAREAVASVWKEVGEYR
jgi:hypothetical protein